MMIKHKKSLKILPFMTHRFSENNKNVLFWCVKVSFHCLGCFHAKSCKKTDIMVIKHEKSLKILPFMTHRISKKDHNTQVLCV